MNILINGAGAMGTIIGALATEAGNNVLLVDSYKAHVDALNDKGAKIVGNINKVVPVKACLPDEIYGEYDLIMSITKHSGIISSLENAKPFLKETGVVMTLQNGFPESKAKSVFNEEQLLGGSMEFSSTFKEPGIVELASDASTVGFTFGTLTGEITKMTKDIKEAFDPIGKINITNNIVGIKWTKLTDNTCFSGLPTALGCEVGAVLDDEFALECAAHVGRECAMVIEAAGIKPEELFGLLPTMQNLGFNSDMELKAVKEYWKKVQLPFKKQVASMLQDIRKGRACEINDINGEVSRTGKKYGIETPYCDKIIEIVTKLQNKELALEDSWENLKYFKFMTQS